MKSPGQQIDNKLITLPRLGSFLSRGVVLCVATKGGAQYDQNAERPILRKPYPLRPPHPQRFSHTQAERASYPV